MARHDRFQGLIQPAFSVSACSRTDRVGSRVLGLVVNAEQLLLVEDHLFAALTREIVEAGQFNRIDGAGFFTHPAEDTSKLVD